MPKIKTIPLLEAIFKNKGGTSDLWKAVCELLYKDDEIAVFCPYVKNKINSFDKQTSILGLNIIDYCVDYGKMPLWKAINDKVFLNSFINNLKTREDQEIQNRILYLIQKWGKKFYDSELTNFRGVYTTLKNNNIEFPDSIENDYHKYVKINNKTNFNNNNNNYNQKNNFNNYSNNTNQEKVETDPEDYIKDINVNLNTTSYEKKYKRLVNKLYDWTHAIHEANVLINQNKGGINNMKIDSLCKDLSNGNKQLIETIQSGKLKDNDLMKISLCVKDDINMTLQRWSNCQKGRNPGPFISSFFQNDEWRAKIKNTKNRDNNNNSNLNNNFNNINSNKFYSSNYAGNPGINYNCSLKSSYNPNNNSYNSNNNNNNNNGINYNFAQNSNNYYDLNNNFNNYNNNNNYNNFNNNINQNNFNNNNSNNFNNNNNQNNFNNNSLNNFNNNNQNNFNNNNQNNFNNNQNNFNNNQNNFGNNSFNMNNNFNNNYGNNNFSNNNIRESNQGSFNLLIDFDLEPSSNFQNNNNNNNNLNLNLNDKNNMNKFVDFVENTEKKNQERNQKSMNNNSINNNIRNGNMNNNNLKKNNMNNIKNNNMNNNNQRNNNNTNNNNQRNNNNKNNNNNKKNNMNSNNKNNNDNNNNGKNNNNSSNVNIKKSNIYPSFEELEQEDNSNNDCNKEKPKEEEDILAKFDF